MEQFTEEQIKQQHYNDIRKELEDFKNEKERVRTIIGQIGGIPKQSVKFLNAFFLIVVIICIPLSLITEGIVQHLILELAIAAISLKLIWIMHNQTRVNHFQLWVLTSLEWRINEMRRMMIEMDEKIIDIHKSLDIPPKDDDKK